MQRIPPPPVSRCPSTPSQPLRAKEPPLLATEKELREGTADMNCQTKYR